MFQPVRQEGGADQVRPHGAKGNGPQDVARLVTNHHSAAFIDRNGQRKRPGIDVFQTQFGEAIEHVFRGAVGSGISGYTSLQGRQSGNGPLDVVHLDGLADRLGVFGEGEFQYLGLNRRAAT